MEQSEQQKFLEDLETPKEDVLETPLEIGEEPAKETAETNPEEEDLSRVPRNRYWRRVLDQKDKYKDEAIALNARLQAIAESQATRQEEPAEYLKRVEKIYGNATPEAIEATNLLKEALEGVKLSAKEEAVKEYESRREAETSEVRKEEGVLDEMLERLEDDHNADFSDETERKGFLNLLEKLSPKDRDGNIIEFADAESVYELYEASKTRTNSRAKELSSRSMTRSGASGDSKLTEDSTARWLKENGLIF